MRIRSYKHRFDRSVPWNDEVGVSLLINPQCVGRQTGSNQLFSFIFKLHFLF